MEKIRKNKLRYNIKIKPSFFIYVLIFLIAALFLSVLTVHIVDKFVSTVSVFYIDGNDDIDRINEDKDEDIYIAVETIDKDFNQDNSDAILFYSRNWIVMAVLILYFIFAVLIAANIFFKRKLDIPLTQLENAAQKISEKDLDFEIEYSGNDEMAKLCESFETMRHQLVQNNKEMWNMIDEQKRVQHVWAHDIRTPLTVTKGYVDILREYIPEGKLSEEKVLQTIECIHRNIIRLENFVNTMSEMQKLDDITINKDETHIESLFNSLKENSEIICKDKQFIFESKSDSEIILTDKSIIEQIISNLISNAARYAKNRVTMECTYLNGKLTIIISDDGNGFSSEALLHALESHFTEEDKSRGVHFGIGLTICKGLCEKLGGNISYRNSNGAQVKIEI